MNSDPTPTQNSKPTWTTKVSKFFRNLKAGFKTLWNRLNIIELLSRFVDYIRNLVVSSEGKVLIVLGGMIFLSAYGIINQHTRLTSGVGLLWLALFLLIYLLASETRKGLKAFDRQLTLDADTSEQFWYQKIVYVFIIGLISFINSAMNTAMGIAIALAYLFTELHVNAATGDFQFLWEKTQWTWLDVIFYIITPVSGIFKDLWDINKDEKEKSALTLLFGIGQFYLSTIFLVTGLFGGGPALLAIDEIITYPIHWLFVELPNVAYSDSSAYTIVSNTGPWIFLIFYFLLPLNSALSSYAQIKAYKLGKPVDLPKETAYGILGVSLLFLLITVYVAWQQGWITMIIEWLIYIIYVIVEFFIKLFSWIGTFFN